MRNNLDELFRRFCRDGDGEALARVFEATAPVLLRRARRLLRSEDAAEDAVQDLFLSLLRGAVTYDPRRPCLPFLHGAMTRHALRQLRRHRGDGEDASTLATTDRGPAAKAEGVEIHHVVRDAVASLPSPYRVVVQLYLERGHTPMEIGRKLNRPAGTIRVQLHRGLAHLRQALPPGAAVLALSLLLTRRTPAAIAGAPSAWSRPATTLLAGAFVTLFAGLIALTFVNQPLPKESQMMLVAREESTVVNPAADEATGIAPAANERIAATPQYLVVNVVDANGSGVPHVGVRATPAGGDADLQSFSLVTGAHGAASFAAIVDGDWLLTTDRGTERHLRISADTPRHCTFLLDEGFTARGVVLDANDNPIAGAQILLSHSRALPTEAVTVASTGADGRFELRQLDELNAIGVAVTDMASPPMVLAYMKRGSDVVFRCTRPSGSVRGIVQTERGPVADALVVVGHSPRTGWYPAKKGFVEVHRDVLGRTNGAGRFCIDGLPAGRHEVLVRGVGCASTVVAVDVIAGRTCEVQILARAGVELRGIVRDVFGAPIPASTVQVEGLSQRHAHVVQTGPDGTFRMAGIDPRRIQLWASAAGHRTARRIVTDPDQTIEFALPPESHLRGQLLDTDGEPVEAGAWQLVVRENDPSNDPVPIDLDAYGCFAAMPVRTKGAFYAVCRPGSMAFFRCDSLQRGEALELRVPANIERQAPVHVALIGYQESDVSWLTFVAIRDSDMCRLFVVGQQGCSLELSPLPVGRWQLEVFSRSPALPSLRVAAFDVADDGARVQVQKPPSGIVNFELTVADGTPLGTFHGWLESNDVRSIPVLAPTGRLVLRAGLWSFKVESMVAKARIHRFEVRAGEEVAVRIEMPRAHVTQVAFWLPSGVDHGSATVCVRAGDDLLYRQPLALVRGGADGYCWLMKTLQPGDHVLELADAHARWSATFTVLGESSNGEPALVDLQPATAPR